MARFKDQDEYEKWKVQQAIKRNAARDLEKIDRERPFYERDKKWSDAGKWLTVALLFAFAVLVAALYVTRPGHDILEWLSSFLKRFLQ